MSFKYWRDGLDDQSVATIPENGNYKAVGAKYISKKNPFAYTEDRLIIDDGCAFDFFDGSSWRQFSNRGTIDVAAADLLDAGSFEVGKDYYIYLCPTADGADIVISANSTFPDGYAAQTSRKIGGFHYGHIRQVSADGKWIPIDSTNVKFGSNGLIWQRNVTTGIVPNSVWDLKNRPHCDPAGMVKVGNTWVAIYQASEAESITFMGGSAGLHIAGGKLQSAYGQLPVTGTEGCNWYTFVELASRQEMRLPSYQEWCAAAFGNPQGEDTDTNYGWTKTNNVARTRTGCSVNGSTGAYDDVTGIKRYAVSAFNIVDAVGNVLEWLSDMNFYQESSRSYNWYNVLGAGMGQAYLANQYGMVSLIAGDYWAHGVYCGSRCVYLLSSTWSRHTNVGVRLACDKLAG
jgi:formylglycine-generating enzyme required for sulfatase activity